MLSAKAQENLAGVRVIRAYAQEDAEMRGFDAPNRDYVTRNLKLIVTWSLFMPALTALVGMTFVLVCGSAAARSFTSRSPWANWWPFTPSWFS